MNKILANTCLLKLPEINFNCITSFVMFNTLSDMLTLIHTFKTTDHNFGAVYNTQSNCHVNGKKKNPLAI